VKRKIALALAVTALMVATWYDGWATGRIEGAGMGVDVLYRQATCINWGDGICRSTAGLAEANAHLYHDWW